MSFSGVVSTVTAALSGKVSKLYTGRVSLIVLHGTILFSVSLLVASIAPSPWISVACLIPISLATSNLKISMLNLLMDRAGTSERGALIGVGESINSLSRMAAPTVVGVAQEHSTTTAGLVSAGMSFVVVVIVAMLHFRGE